MSHKPKSKSAGKSRSAPDAAVEDWTLGRTLLWIVFRENSPPDAYSAWKERKGEFWQMREMLEARDELQAALRAGKIVSHGLPPVLASASYGLRTEVPALVWADMKIELGWPSHGFLINQSGRPVPWRSVYLPGDKVVARWPASASKPNRRGRKPTYDRGWAEDRLKDLFEHHGEFMAGDSEWSCQADAERALVKIFEAEKGVSPGESTMRDIVTEYLRKQALAKANNSGS